MKNPYEVLGLTSGATQEQIKKAYRSLVKKYHPDKNPGNKSAEEKFKEVANAFELIGTEDARAKFDRGEAQEQQQQYQNPFGQGFHQTEEEFLDQDFFDQIFRKTRKPRREDHQYKMDIDFKESVLGTEKVITLLNGKNLQVKIPSGIESGKKLRFKGQGAFGGDVYIEITVKPHKGFKRVNNNIEVEVPISYIEAILGAEIPVPTIDGTIMLKIPAGVSTGSKLRVKGKGIISGKEHGDQIVKLKVETPKKIDPALANDIRELSKKYSFNPRV